MLEFKQPADPLADAKAWLARMEKTLAKLAAECGLQNGNDDGPPECGRLPSNSKMIEGPDAQKK
jgi:hypothetical protein